MNKLQVLADHYPIEDLLEQNDVETITVVEWLVEEGFINVNDYFYEDEMIERDD